MKKKKTYIRPEMDIMCIDTPRLMGVSYVNDSPYADAKKKQETTWEDEDWEDEEEEADTDEWRTGYDTGMPRHRSLWGD